MTTFERAQREELVRLVSRRARAPGSTATAISWLSLLAAERPNRIAHGVIEPSLCLVVQGEKRLLVRAQQYRYGAGSYSMSAIEYPTAGHVTKAPYLAVRATFTPGELAAVIAETGTPVAAAPAGEPVYVSEADARLWGALLRVVQLLDEPDGGAALAAGAKRELIVRLLRTDRAPLIARSVTPTNLGVGRALDWLRQHYAEHVDIEVLAKRSRMSVSSLRHEFKAATALAPLEFQKQLRLVQARRLLLAGEADAGGAAFAVGYKSASQFSREYRRMFGAPPVRDVKAFVAAL
ncbi:MAG TPA: AraC family transcriptional regulator [Kofleriaceae bacterium]